MALPFPDISHELITLPALHLWGHVLGPFPIRWYALGYIFGILLGWRYAVALVHTPRLWIGRRLSISAGQVDDLVVWLTFGIILGGRIGYILFYMVPLADQRAELGIHPWIVFETWNGGMSFHGGLIGVIVATLAFARQNRLSVLDIGDVIAPAFPIGIFLVRIANFINGELWGRITHVPWALVFCGRHLATDSLGQCIAGPEPRHPSQLYEAALEGLVLFFILRWATHRSAWLQKPGATAGLFLVGYAVMRMSLENVRMPDAGFRELPLGLTMGMILSAPMFLGGACLLWRAFLTRHPHVPESH